MGKNCGYAIIYTIEFAVDNEILILKKWLSLVQSDRDLSQLPFRFPARAEICSEWRRAIWFGLNWEDALNYFRDPCFRFAGAGILIRESQCSDIIASLLKGGQTLPPEALLALNIRSNYSKGA
jgi:hypothetical protein